MFQLFQVLSTPSKFFYRMFQLLPSFSSKLIEIPDECMVCYERFPVSLKFFCGHELCALCAENIMAVCDNKTCPKCRADFPELFTEWLPMINLYPIYLTPNIPVEKLQRVFPLICFAGNLTRVAKCINMGMDVNTKGICGSFPIHLASQKNVVKYLINNGANMNQPSDSGITPLLWSSQMGDLPVVKYLIKIGAKINEVHQCALTPLFVSSQEGHLPVVKYLVQNGGDISINPVIVVELLFVQALKKIIYLLFNIW